MRALLILLLLAGSAHAGTLIRADYGGRIDKYERWVRHARGPIVVDGDCVSACTMILIRHDVCATAGAMFGFHQAVSGDGRPSRKWTARLMRYYPTGVRAWIARTGGLRYGQPIPASAADLGVPPCQS